MRTKTEIEALLDELNTKCADDLEAQDLDFKEWDVKSYADSGAIVLETVICLANAEGGTIVIGVKDNVIGRSKAILGVPTDFDSNKLKQMIYDNTDPRLTPVVEELPVLEGSGRLIAVHVHPGMPPYTDRKGRAKIRVGKDCQPFTGSMRQRVLAASGEHDLLRQEIDGPPSDLLSPSGMERLRQIALKQNAPKELLQKTDQNLLEQLLLVRGGRMTKGGLLLVGRDDAISEIFPSYAWSYLLMRSGSDYIDRSDGKECIAIAIGRIEDRIMAHNPLTTMRQGLLHFEYRTYPEVAIREALLNAFVHADYRIPGLIQIKQFEDRLEIANPGGLIGGVAPDNILRHTPISRNPSLVNALIPLRLVNRSNLGVHRMYEAMLQEGKEPPIIRDAGDSVRVSFLRSDFSFAFRAFVAEAAHDGSLLSLEELLIMQYLLRHGEIDELTAAHICQQEPREAKENLRKMQKKKILQCIGRGNSSIWLLAPKVEQKLVPQSDSSATARVAVASQRILETLQSQYEVGKAGLTNTELREITGLERDQVKYVMQRMREQGLVRSTGRGRTARWILATRLPAE